VLESVQTRQIVRQYERPLAVAEGKERIQPVVDRALNEGPQTVTRHGKPVVVVSAIAGARGQTRNRAASKALLALLRVALRILAVSSSAIVRWLAPPILDELPARHLRCIGTIAAPTGLGRRRLDVGGDVVSLHLSAITIGELRHGTLRLPVGKRRTSLSAGSKSSDRVFPGACSRRRDRCAALAEIAARAEQAAGRIARDGLIAATALDRGLTLVTRNVTDFEAFGISLLNPWTAS